MKIPRAQAAAALIVALGIGLAGPASAHDHDGRWDRRGPDRHERWEHRHRDYHPAYRVYRAPPVIYAPPLVYGPPRYYGPPPVYYDSRPTVVIGLPPLVIPLR